MLRKISAPSPAAAAPRRSADALDQSLMKRVVARDLRAFEALYRIYHPRLDRFLGLVTPRPTIVEEAVNDTMLVVWRRAATYSGECKVSTWIFAIAYRKAMKALQRWDEPVGDAAADEDRAPPDAEPEQQLAQSQLRALLSGALEGLSAEQRAVVALTYLHGVGYREIAEIVGCPVDTVKTRMFYARRRLKALLGDRLGDWL